MNWPRVSFGLLLTAAFVAPCHADVISGWGIGETPDDFNALYVDAGTGSSTPVSWYDESGADVYVISACAMWCTPCQLFGADSGGLAQTLAAEGIQAEVYDYIFEDVQGLEPDLNDAQAWLDNIWTGDPDNVWFGGDIPFSATNSVIEDIMLAAQSSAVPTFVILDRSMTVRHHLTGYAPQTLEDLARQTAATAVPEPTLGFVVLMVSAFTVANWRTRD